ncbi:MAG TPA: CHASE domain-containing protein [Candidatus Saccharimonadales bacterium]|nr:CHASE domain-containing protein [Candidatus Saccharimonadales bacterium]
MYRLKSKLIATGAWVKRHTRMHVVVTVMVLGIGLTAAGYYWNNLRQSVQMDLRTAYDRQVADTARSAVARLTLYESLLRSSGGLYKINEQITQAEWDAFHEPYDIATRYPDIEGIGLSQYVKRADLSEYLRRRRAQGDADYTIYPQGNRDVYVPVTFNAGYIGNNSKSRGYDGYTDEVRRTAMDRAIDTGKPAMTGKVSLVSESRSGRPSFLLYMPIYKEGASVRSVQERQAAIVGFSYMAVDIKSLAEAIYDAGHSPNLAIKVLDAEADTKNNFVYQSEDYNFIMGQNGSVSDTRTISFYGHRYRVTFAGPPQLLSDRERQLPGQALWRGILTSVFFAGLVWYLVNDRERKYARQKQEEVQTAKDDLLSLASHQLRTPATVVKQYVGMLLQGYGGKLSDQQIDMLNNAYDSNERQLDIINQLLYVARLDADRIQLRTERLDVSTLLRSVAHEHEQSAAARGQRIAVKAPKRAIWAEVDPHYIRMAFDNLLSNAVKYTPEGGSINVSVRRSHGRVVVKVSDNGVGIEQAAQARVFEKFTRVENELSTDVNGSGVGLYLTNKIILLHHGSIELASEVGVGSVFTVYLPFSQPYES